MIKTSVATLNTSGVVRAFYYQSPDEAYRWADEVRNNAIVYAQSAERQKRAGLLIRSEKGGWVLYSQQANGARFRIVTDTSLRVSAMAAAQHADRNGGLIEVHGGGHFI